MKEVVHGKFNKKKLNITFQFLHRTETAFSTETNAYEEDRLRE
jgi:hypothetical protein